jgi:hypothetical protein
MWWALFKKELRELAPIGLAACLGLLVAVVAQMRLEVFRFLPFSLLGLHSGEVASVPFLDRAIHTPLALIAGVIATLIAAHQTGREDLGRTFSFLLHLPMRRTSVFLTKILAGCLAYLAALSLPVLVYALWVASPGHYPSPFFWSMIGIPFALILAFMIGYLGWFLTFLRPARVFGTRLFPAVTATGIGFICAKTLNSSYWGLLLVAVAGTIYAACICRAAEVRDY